MNKRDYYKQVAQLHIRNIDQGFLSTLGGNFVSLMYQAIDEGDDSALLTVTDEGRIVGFVTGAAGMGPIYSRMLKRWPRLIWSLLPSMFSPRKLRRIAEIMRYSRLRGNAPPNLPVVELLSLAVDPAYRGRKYSERLYTGLMDDFARRGVQSFKIIVGEKLEPAHKFYRRMGAIPMTSVEVHEGENSTVYVQQITARQ